MPDAPEPRPRPTPPADLAARALELTAPFRDLYPFAPHFLATGAGHLHYLDEGPADGAPILALHGNPTWSFYWRKAVRALAGDFRVVVPDHLGCGLSDKPREWRYDLAGHVDNLEQLVLALGLERITLLVHDWGGAIGMGLAARRPELVARLAITNTAAFHGPVPRRILLCRTPVLGRLLVQGLNGFALPATFLAVERPLERRTRRALLAPYGTFASRLALWKFVADIPTRPSHPTFAAIGAIADSLDRLADRPTCILWGERDWCFTPHFRREWQARFPGAEVHKHEDAGHYLMEDAGDAVARELRDWLARHPLRTAEAAR